MPASSFALLSPMYLLLSHASAIQHGPGPWVSDSKIIVYYIVINAQSERLRSLVAAKIALQQTLFHTYLVAYKATIEHLRDG